MTELMRRRGRGEVEHIYGDVVVDSIGGRTGAPNHADQWEWKCGFHPGLRPEARPRPLMKRAAFEAVWGELLPTLTEANFQA